MRGKVCVVTGASAGIGLQTAVALARLGACVAIVCRTAEKGERAVAEIGRRSPGADVRPFVADLSSQRAVRALAAGAPARIVNVASRAHRSGTLRFDDLMGARAYDPMQAYAQSKLANIVFTYELARRLRGTGVTANCLHPGVVATNFGNAGPALIRLGARLGRPFLRSAARGAATSVYLASAPEVEGVTGKYFVDERERPSSAESYVPTVAARLWRVSEELTEPSAGA